jgi:hypothetical protein
LHLVFVSADIRLVVVGVTDTVFKTSIGSWLKLLVTKAVLLLLHIEYTG